MWKRVLGFLAFPIGLLVVMTVAFSITNATRMAQKELRETYLGQTIEVESPSLGQKFQFSVKTVSGTCVPRVGFAYLDGIVIINHPQGTKYLGAAHGSTTINWQRDDGSGFTWFLNDLQLPRGTATPCALYFRITGVDVR